ncbi:MAG: TonB-dependent receptor [Gammaproteobacteria bacterium]|nr:TonB-dependent receptor [Gammaproteobacteria bacterium]
MRGRHHLPFLLVLCALSPARAAEGDRLNHFLSLSLEELMAQEITISTHARQTLTEAPAVVSIITADEIKATGATNLMEMLEGVPGLHVRANQFAFRPLPQFRGANATQTLAMVNGVPMRDLMWGFGIFWKGLPVSVVERVEIIRGPGSAMYGADASAGVINVITKTAGRIEGSEVGGRVGSFNSNTAWAQHGGSWRGYEVGFTAELSSSDGHDPYIVADRQTADDPASSLAPASAGYGWRSEDLRLSLAKDDWRLLADYVRHSELEVGLTGGGVLDPLTRASDRRYNVDLLYDNERFGRDWGVNAELRYHHLDYTSGEGFQERPPGYDDGSVTYPDGVINRMRSAENRLALEVSGLYSGLPRHAIRLGAGVTQQDLYSVEQWRTDPDNPTQLVELSDTAAAFAPENARTIQHLYLQDVWSLAETLELTAGARYDHYCDFGDTLNPRLALVWQNSARLTSKLMYGQAFRAPSYQELYASTSYAQPNADLEPERSQTVELAFVYAASRKLQLNMNLFHFRQSGLIKRDVVTGQYVNSGDHAIRGIELEAQWQAARNLRVSGNVTLREQDESSYRTLDEADRDAYVRLDWGFRPGWNWNLQGNWVGERERALTDTRPAASDYLLTDTTLRYAAHRWELAASVRNLFDVAATASTGTSLPYDLPLPGRTLYAELRYQF